MFDGDESKFPCAPARSSGGALWPAFHEVVGDDTPIIGGESPLCFYETAGGDIGIAQSIDCGWRGADVAVFVPRDRALEAVEAILQLAGLNPRDVWGARRPADRTAAERQRRHRMRKRRHGVTALDAVTRDVDETADEQEEQRALAL